jgi:aarF domain-containing kinase
MAVLAPAAFYFGEKDGAGEEAFWRYFVWAMETLGPTYIKLCQWASTRPDMFPHSLTKKLERLQDHVTAHPWHETVKAMEQSFGKDWESMIELERDPIGSGCIAQVYRGTLKRDGTEQEVAVKLVHPNVKEGVSADMDLLRTFAAYLERNPKLKYLSPTDTVEEFAKVMQLQMDLRVEANNLDRFGGYFKDAKHKVLFAKPFKGLVTEDALVEEFMVGDSVCQYMQKDVDKELQKAISNIGTDAVLKMIFTDNFIHRCSPLYTIHCTLY